jgi:ABC-type multidrug transport system ATPase subunit
MDVNQQEVDSARPRVLLEWKDVKYSVGIKNKETKHTDSKEILHGISGFANPGQFLAIMGASGAGKTTLLNILSDRIGGGGNSTVEGEIKANGALTSEIDFGSYSAYVMQDDVLLDTMSPRESFLFSAKLRIAGSVAHK